MPVRTVAWRWPADCRKAAFSRTTTQSRSDRSVSVRRGSASGVRGKRPSSSSRKSPLAAKNRSSRYRCGPWTPAAAASASAVRGLSARWSAMSKRAAVCRAAEYAHPRDRSSSSLVTCPLVTCPLVTPAASRRAPAIGAGPLVGSACASQPAGGPSRGARVSDEHGYRAQAQQTVNDGLPVRAAGPLPKRRTAGRTCGRLMFHRRPARDCDTLPARSRAVIRPATTGLMARRPTGAAPVLRRGRHSRIALRFRDETSADNDLRRPGDALCHIFVLRVVSTGAGGVRGRENPPGPGRTSTGAGTSSRVEQRQPRGRARWTNASGWRGASRRTGAVCGPSPTRCSAR